jgi:prepilin-type N-terminal cleavage/methylation domain-containing protein
MNRGKGRNGFSLLELLIVVAVILIISAIAIPRFIRSKMSANEASAVGSLKTIITACQAYSNIYTTGFPVGLANLGPGTPATAAAADLIDNVLVTGTKSGYRLIYVSGAPVGGKVVTYTINANPVAPNQTGQRFFFTDQTGVIRYALTGAATIASSPL